MELHGRTRSKMKCRFYFGTITKNVVSKVLYEEGFRRRKPQKKKTMGQNKDRDAQFRNLKRLKQEYLDAGKPVLSMDTKKKETLGNFYREGVTDAIEPTIVNDHDFPSQGNGKVIPHGNTTWEKTRQ